MITVNHGENSHDFFHRIRGLLIRSYRQVVSFLLQDLPREKVPVSTRMQLSSSGFRVLRMQAYRVSFTGMFRIGFFCQEETVSTSPFIDGSMEAGYSSVHTVIAFSVSFCNSSEILGLRFLGSFNRTIIWPTQDFDWLIDWLIGRLIAWWVVWLIDWLNVCLIDWMVVW